MEQNLESLQNTWNQFWEQYRLKFLIDIYNQDVLEIFDELKVVFASVNPGVLEVKAMYFVNRENNFYALYIVGENVSRVIKDLKLDSQIYTKGTNMPPWLIDVYHQKDAVIVDEMLNQCVSVINEEIEKIHRLTKEHIKNTYPGIQKEEIEDKIYNFGKLILKKYSKLSGNTCKQ